MTSQAFRITASTSNIGGVAKSITQLDLLFGNNEAEDCTIQLSVLNYPIDIGVGTGGPEFGVSMQAGNVRVEITDFHQFIQLGKDFVEWARDYAAGYP